MCGEGRVSSLNPPGGKDGGAGAKARKNCGNSSSCGSGSLVTRQGQGARRLRLQPFQRLPVPPPAPTSSSSSRASPAPAAAAAVLVAAARAGAMRAAGPLALLQLLLWAGAGMCAATAAPPAPPLFNVSLDAAPELRWLPVLQHFDLDFLRTAMAHILENSVPRWVYDVIRKAVGELEHLLPQPFTDEIRGMCSVLNFSLADCVLINLAYESTAFCTSIVAQDSRGHIYHGRNMDYPFGNFLRKLTVDVQFLKNGQIAFTGTTFVGYVGLWTGQSPYQFTVSADERGDRNELLSTFVLVQYYPRASFTYPTEDRTLYGRDLHSNVGRWAVYL